MKRTIKRIRLCKSLSNEKFIEIDLADNSFYRISHSEKSFDEIKKEIKNYKGFVKDAINLLSKGKLRHDAYKRLADFVDRFGPRMSGTPVLEKSLACKNVKSNIARPRARATKIHGNLQKYLENELLSEKLENVHAEDVMVPHWVRGNESCRLLIPRQKDLKIRTLGSSIGTPKEGLEANAIVVESFDELKKRRKEVKGKIVVYNQPFREYKIAREYRLNGASEAAKLGAVAALIRSVTPFSIYSPHTGWQDYQEDVPKIPVASLTVEDAELLARLQNRSDPLIIKLFLGAHTLPDVKSKNLIAEIKGYEKPEEVVIIGAHVDSWDIGEGAMDDGSGVFVTLEAMVALVALELRPKRTIRAVFWTAEETGMWAGAKQYYKNHRNETPFIVLAMEADEGIYNPLGIKFQGPKEAQKIMKEVMKLLAPINATKFSAEDVDYGQTQWFLKDGAPGAMLWTEGQEEEYFYYHHTEADTMTIVNADHLDLATALWAAVTYIAADLDERIPSQIVLDMKKREKEKKLKKIKKKKQKKEKKSKKKKTDNL